MNPETGYDLGPELVGRIDRVLKGALVCSDPSAEAQLRELGFWRWVAFEGYAGQAPMAFFDHQQRFMTGCYSRTGWPIDRFVGKAVFELGCGPVGMIEFIPGARRVAFDPLNEHYDVLFKKLRNSGVEYISKRQDIVCLSPVDFGICFNVLDHTNDAQEWLDVFFSCLKPGGDFLVQVNTVRDGFERSIEHRRMHPSPLTHEQIAAMLDKVAIKFDWELASEPSADNEFFYMAWGQKRLD